MWQNWIILSIAIKSVGSNFIIVLLFLVRSLHLLFLAYEFWISLFKERLESLLDSLDLLLALFLEFLVDSGHIFGHSLLLELLKPS